MKLDQGIAAAVGVTVALYLFAVSFGWTLFGAETTVPQWQQSYACGEFQVNTAFSDDFSILYVEGVGEPLLYTESESGSLYINDFLSFFFRGETLVITNMETGVVLGECAALSDAENAPLNFGD